MLVDQGSVGRETVDVRDSARHAEAVGYNTFFYAETKHDPFLPLVLAAEHTERIRLGTGIALAFARNPMTLAASANDIQQFSEGRLLLGLGSQIKPHITRRFSMPWSRPAARMREFVLALHAIWDAWNNEAKLDFRGEFYSHTLMTPFFAPDPNPYGAPKVMLAGVGERMSEVVGEVADGFLGHSLTTARYLDEVILPAVARGRVKSGRTDDGFEASGQLIVITGRDEAEMARVAETARQSIAFYLSTPAYRSMLDVFGWGDRQDELTRLSKLAEWDAMTKLVDDEMLDTFTIWAEPDAVAAKIVARFGGRYDRVGFTPDMGVPPELFDDIARQVLAATSA
jgi:probable F420-dependent oxidoreductase